MTGGVGSIQSSLAEFAAVDAALLAPKPSNLKMREAVGLPLFFITAWEGLIDRAQIQARTDSRWGRRRRSHRRSTRSLVRGGSFRDRIGREPRV